MNDIKRMFTQAVMDHSKQHEIIAQFQNGREVTYTMQIFNLLKTDKEIACIIDAETAEILFCR